MMSNLKFWIYGMSLAFLGCVGSVFAATQIQGTIISDLTHRPVSGAHIQILLNEESQIAFSRPDGQFEFNIPDEDLSETLMNGQLQVKTLKGENISIGSLKDQVANQFLLINPEVDQSVFLSEIKMP